MTASSDHAVRLDEFVTWSHRDKHAQAYVALSSAAGRAIAAKLGIGDASTARVCLDCHSDNVGAQQRGAGFTITDGVGCEACHGGAERWLVSHSARDATYRNNVARGMYPTADLGERTQLCLACHAGNADKFVTHRIMGAGHPRLSFELATYLALQPAHYEQDADYRERKPSYPRAQVWACGQLAAAQREMELLQGALLRTRSFLPELALLDCHACHENPLHRLDWGTDTVTRSTQPGSVTFPKGHVEMALIIARYVAPGLEKEMLVASRQLQRAAGEDRESIAARAAALERLVARTLAAARAHRWSRDEDLQMLADIAQQGSAGEYRDYISAEQAVMAVEGLAADAGVAEQYRELRDALFRAVRDEDAYRPAELREAFARLRASLRD